MKGGVNMSQMPSKIWLHKDTKYSIGDTVCCYQYDFVQGIEDEGGIENFVKYVPAFGKISSHSTGRIKVNVYDLGNDKPV